MSKQAFKQAIASAAGRIEDPLANWMRPPRDECPICLITLPLSEDGFFYKACCGIDICVGCIYDTAIHDIGVYKCPFCRHEDHFDNHIVNIEEHMKLAKAGRPRAMMHVGTCYLKGRGVKQDKGEAIKLFRQAAEVGNGTAAQNLAICYWEGVGVNKDLDLALKYCETAAELGNYNAYYSAAVILMEMGDIEESTTNLRKAAMCGVSKADIFEKLRYGYKCGLINENEYAFTLREYQKASNEMKSEAREKF
mmetsp:Transcript_29484/g.62581  ORF Transcript_29484/g.62581 Transcript_29484/m.62581 type:complete len:251 (+) Transcript_29484:306-1058(+)